jgi:hypothetical protein
VPSPLAVEGRVLMTVKRLYTGHALLSRTTTTTTSPWPALVPFPTERASEAPLQNRKPILTCFTVSATAHGTAPTCSSTAGPWHELAAVKLFFIER